MLLAALPAIRAAVGDLEVAVAGHGAPPARSALASDCRRLGGVDETTRRALLAGTDVFVAPHGGPRELRHRGAGGAGDRGRGGRLRPARLRRPARLADGAPLGGIFRRGDPGALAHAVVAVLRDGERRQPGAGRRSLRYDWSRVAPEIEQVYLAVVAERAGSVDSDGLDRVRRTWTALDDALIRRARRAIEVAGPDVRDPSTLRLHQAAVAALAAAGDGVPSRTGSGRRAT